MQNGGLIVIPTFLKITQLGDPSYLLKEMPFKYLYESNDIKERSETHDLAVRMYDFGAGVQSFTSFRQQLTGYVTLLTSSL